MDTALTTGALRRSWPRSRHQLGGWNFALSWVVAVAVTGALVLADRHLRGESQTFGAIALGVLLLANIGLFLWLRPIPAATGAVTTRRLKFAAVIAAAVLVLFPAGVVGVPVLVPVLILAVVAAWMLRAYVGPREVRYALLLGCVAAGGGSLDWVANRNLGDLAFALFQAPLAATALVAGWAVARKVGWTGLGIARARFLTSGTRAAARSFLFGALLATPWALGNIAGGLFGDRMTAVWQPLSALRPAIAEEAWGRVLLIGILFLLFSRFAKPRAALIAAGIVGGLWFAWLHVPLNPFVTVLMALIYAAPMILLWLRRDLEAAIGFHFFSDFVRFGATYLAFQGLWFS